MLLPYNVVELAVATAILSKSIQLTHDNERDGLFSLNKPQFSSIFFYSNEGQNLNPLNDYSHKTLFLLSPITKYHIHEIKIRLTKYLTKIYNLFFPSAYIKISNKFYERYDNY